MIPGAIESAIVVEPLGDNSARGFGGWCIVDGERKRPHEAIFLPIDPLETNEASVLRVSLHQTSGFKFKSLVGRFRISYTEDDRIREILLPAQTKLWSSVGPFPAEDVTKAFATAFEPEKDVKEEPLDLKKSYDKVVLAPAPQGGPPAGPGGGTVAKAEPAAKATEAAKPEGAAAPVAAPKKPDGEGPEKKAATPDGAAKGEPATTPSKPNPEKAGSPSGAKADAAAPGAGNRASKKGDAESSKGAAGEGGAAEKKMSKDAEMPEPAKPAAKGGPGGDQAKRPVEKVAWSEQRKSARRLPGPPPGRQFRLLPGPQGRLDTPAHRDAADRWPGRVQDVAQRGPGACPGAAATDASGAGEEGRGEAQ